MNKPIVLDKDTGCSWKGRRGPRRHALGHDSKGFVRLHDLHAIQLITEACTSDSDKSPKGFYSYEINLVLNDSRHVGNAQLIASYSSMVWYE